MDDYGKWQKSILLRAMGKTEKEANADGYAFVSYHSERLPDEVSSRMLKDCKRLGLTPPAFLLNGEAPSDE
jgi:hypothetical protein